MVAVEQPITRSELREELDRSLEHYATKEDLAHLKADLIKWVAGLQIASMVAIAAILRFLS